MLDAVFHYGLPARPKSSADAAFSVIEYLYRTEIDKINQRFRSELYPLAKVMLLIQ